MPNKLKNVWQVEWDMAKDYFRLNPGAVKWSRKKTGLPHSFIQIDGKLYAMGQHLDYLGKPGQYGKAKIVQDEQGNNFALKIEGQRDAYDASRADELAVMRELGHLKGAVDRPYTGGKKWLEKENIVAKSYTLQTLFEGVNLHDYMVDFDAVVYEDGNADHKYENRRPLTERLIIALNMARAVQKLQDKNIVHADLKAPNMILDIANGYTVHIIDYAGAKKLVHQDAKTHMRFASPLYAPGTIMVGGKISLKTDIFALGRIFELMDLEDPMVDAMLGANAGRPPLDHVIRRLEQEIAKQPDRHLYNVNPKPAVAPAPAKVPVKAPAPAPAKIPQVPAIPARPVLGVRTPAQILADYQQQLGQRDPNDPFIKQLQLLVAHAPNMNMNDQRLKMLENGARIAAAGLDQPRRREPVIVKMGPAPQLWQYRAPIPAVAPVPADQAGLDLELLNDFRNILKTAQAELAIRILDELAARYAKQLIEKLEQIDILEFIEAYPRNSAKAQAILNWKPELKAQKHPVLKL